MKQSNIDFLEQNRRCYLEVSGPAEYGYSAQLASKIDAELLNIMREEFEPGYPFDNGGGCGPCLINLVRALYQKFDAYLEKHKPKAVEVRANFPKHNTDEQLSPTDMSEYQEFLAWKKMKAAFDNMDQTKITESVINKSETTEQRKARLADPNRVIKRRAKRT